MTFVKCLGCQTANGTVQLGPEKTKAIENFPVPKKNAPVFWVNRQLSAIYARVCRNSKTINGIVTKKQHLEMVKCRRRWFFFIQSKSSKTTNLLGFWAVFSKWSIHWCEYDRFSCNPFTRTKRQEITLSVLLAVMEGLNRFINVYFQKISLPWQIATLLRWPVFCY